MNFRRSIQLSMLVAGASAMSAQIIFLREFLVVFYGNEISIGIILGSWLIWGAIGSWISGVLSDRIHSKVPVFIACQVSVAVILPFTLVFIRLCKSFMGISPGEIAGFCPMFIATFVVLSIPCAVLAFMFALACRMYREEVDDPARGISYIYAIEAVGALTGGLIVSYFLIRFIAPLNILFILSFLSLLAAFIMQGSLVSKKARRAFRLITLLLLVAGLTGLITGQGNILRQFSIKKLWPGFNVLDSRDTPYGNITVTKKGDTFSFYENGLHLYTVPDLLSVEEAVNYPMLETRDPRTVLLIGGGVGGLLAELLKYPVKEIDYVELDPAIIQIARKFLKQQVTPALDDPAVSIINADGRFFVKRTSKRYDCIIINLGDPYTAQVNRFYTVEFFRELNRILNPGGVISFSLTSSANYVSNELKNYLGSIYLSAKKVFPEVVIMPGDTAYFLASNTHGVLTRNSKILTERMKERGIVTKYFQEYYLFDKLSDDRIDYITDIVSSDTNIGINTDFKPISYYYATAFWGTQFDAPFFRRLLALATSGNIYFITALFCFFILIFCNSSRKLRRRRTVLFAVMTTGFAEIIFQIAVMLAFQVIYGYMFYKVGVIITAFMIGLAIGGWGIARYLPRIKDDISFFAGIQAAICIYPLILPVIFLWLSSTQSDIVSWLGSNIIFPFLPVIAGIIGGIQFPLANRICLRSSGGVGRIAGITYGLDLLGACIGSFLAAAFFVPVLGIFMTCLVAALINTVILGILLMSRYD